MTIKEIYEYIDNIGALVFSTIYKDEVHSRMAYFNGYDDEGLYFATAITSPFGRQLDENKKVTACGITDGKALGHDNKGRPIFAPSYSIKLIGEIKNVPAAVIKQKAKTNPSFKGAVSDINQFPAMADGNYVMYKARGEILDVDFELKNRDHQILRTRFEFGGMEYNQAGPTIDNSCIGCRKCKEICSYNAIDGGPPYIVNPNKCTDCGSCVLACPVSAIHRSSVF